MEEDIEPYELLSHGEKTILHTLLQQVALMRKDWISGVTCINTTKVWRWVLRDTLEGLSKLFLLSLPRCCFA